MNIQLLNNLATYNIIPYIYELNNGDALIIHKEDINTYLILEGIMLLQKLFSNNEIVTTHILSRSNLIDTPFQNSHEHNYCYKIEAISKTYLSSFSSLYKERIFALLIHHKCHYSFYHYLSTAEILIHKNSKHRLIHLLLLLSEQFGKKYRKTIIIELNMSHTILASIIGSNTNTISKLIKTLEKLRLISYKKDKIIIYSLALLNSNSYKS